MASWCAPIVASNVRRQRWQAGRIDGSNRCPQPLLHVSGQCWHVIKTAERLEGNQRIEIAPVDGIVWYYESTLLVPRSKGAASMVGAAEEADPKYLSAGAGPADLAPQRAQMQ
jgi:hypothetical protein